MDDLANLLKDATIEYRAVSRDRKKLLHFFVLKVATAGGGLMLALYGTRTDQIMDLSSAILAHWGDTRLFTGRSVGAR
jgi:hypothetical protein